MSSTNEHNTLTGSIDTPTIISTTGVVNGEGNLDGIIDSNEPLSGDIGVGIMRVYKELNIDLDTLLVKTEQELTDEEIDQVHDNLQSAGRRVAGRSYILQSVVDGETVDLDPITASYGSEVFNSYTSNVATGSYSRASGYNTQATGDYSIADGFGCKATNICAIATGRNTLADGVYSHSEGIGTNAADNSAHAEGDSTKATAARAHSEGYATEASNKQAHAEGMNTVASGLNSHAEGEYSKAQGRASWAGGARSVASGTRSFANGYYTIAAGANQTVHGKYNISDTTNLMVVGNGTAEEARSNAFTMSDKGEGWFAGDVYIGSTSGINKDAGSKKLATEEYVDNAVYIPQKGVDYYTEEDKNELINLILEALQQRSM